MKEVLDEAQVGDNEIIDMTFTNHEDAPNLDDLAEVYFKNKLLYIISNSYFLDSLMFTYTIFIYK